MATESHIHISIYLKTGLSKWLFNGNLLQIFKRDINRNTDCTINKILLKVTQNKSWIYND